MREALGVFVQGLLSVGQLGGGRSGSWLDQGSASGVAKRRPNCTEEYLAIVIENLYAGRGLGFN